MPSSIAPPPVSTTPEVSAVSSPQRIELALHQREDLLEARLDDLGQRAARELARRAPADGRHLDRLGRRHAARERRAVALLQQLGLAKRRAQPGGDVARDVVAADRQHRGVLHRAAGEDEQAGRAGADVDHRDAELLLLRRQHRLGGGERREDEVDDVQAGALAALDDVLRRGDRRR